MYMPRPYTIFLSIWRQNTAQVYMLSSEVANICFLLFLSSRVTAAFKMPLSGIWVSPGNRMSAMGYAIATIFRAGSEGGC